MENLPPIPLTVTHVDPRREFTHPELDADQIHPGDFAEKGSSVEVPGVPSGTLTLWVLNPFDESVAHAIATKVVA